MTQELTTTLADGDRGKNGDPRLPWRTLGPEKIAFGLLWLTLGLIVFLNRFGQLTPDIKPEIYLAPGRSAIELLSSWFEDQQLGLPNFNVGLAPVAAFVALLHALGLSPELSMRVLRLLLLSVGGWGTVRLYAHVARDRATPVGRVLAAVVYLVNPYVWVAGDTLAITLPLAFLPWQVLFLMRALEEPRGWRWPAMFALTFVAMGGMNAGVVPAMQLLYVPAVLWYVVRRSHPQPRLLLASLARCAVLTGLVSLYWLLPALAASGVGGNVVNNSETFRGIAGPSSFAEVLRGLGLWVMYGRGPSGPWQPGFSSYLTNPFVVVASFALPVLFAASALVVRGSVRQLAMIMVGLAAVVMVGLHPPDRLAPVGSAMRFLFEHSAAAAFRTTNKAGAVLVLGMALLVAVAGAAVARRLSPSALVASAAALALLFVAGAWPAFSGGLYSDSLTVPSYWSQAAAAADAGSAYQRVWLVPGQVRSDYRWSQERVDDIDKSLLSRPSVVQYTIPAAVPESANFLTAVDTAMQEGSLPPGAVSAAARYMGVSDVLVRNDLVWEQTNGARPATVQAQVAPDTGLLPDGVFGAPGENSVAPGQPPASAFEAALPPLERYQVTDSRAMLRVEPLAGGVLVDGDGWAVAPLVAAGLLDRQPVFRYLGETDPAGLGQALQAGTRLVITDTNRRRQSLTDRLADSQGPLLGAGQPTGPSRVLFSSAAQTVLRVEGGEVTATSEGSVFGALPYAAPENAFDTDERTAWLFGDFGNAVGQSVRVRLDSPHTISRLHLVMRPVGPVVIARVRLRVGDLLRSLDVPSSGVLDVQIPPTTTQTVELTVLRTSGSGINLVGVNEIGISGVKITRVARMPTQLTGLARQLDPADKARLAQTPIDVVFSRVRGTESSGDDEEIGLNRDFTLPQERTFRLYGLVRPDSAAADERIDALLGYRGNVVATSSSRVFGSPDVRASFAVDGSPYTGWSPASPVVGQSLTLRGPPQRVDHIDVLQPAGATGAPASFASEVQVYLDGRLVADAALHPGLSRIPVLPQTAGELRLVIAGQTGTGFVQFSEVHFGNAHISPAPATALAGCVPVAELDGQVLSMRPLRPLTGMGPTVFSGCGAPLTLTAGPHRLRALQDWMPDELVLRDRSGDQPSPGPTVVPDTSIQRLSATHWRITATLPAGPQVLVLGQNYDPRWTATIDGRSAGPVTVADGYSAAWIVTAPGRHTMDIRFGPQQASTVALFVSCVAVALCVGLALLGRRRRVPLRPGSQARTTPRAGRRSRGPVWRGTGSSGDRGAGGAVLAWAGVVLAAWLLGGLPVGAVALVLALWHLWRAPDPRRLIQLSVVLLVLCPVTFVVGNASRWGVITPDLVLQNEWPHWLAAVALLLLFVGVWREDRAPATPQRAEAPPASGTEVPP